MNDHDFLTAFENNTLPHGGFPHHAHIRMAWLYLRANGWGDGIKKIRDGIQRFAAANGASGKYHETITLFWAHMVNQAITRSLETDDFALFIQTYPHLLNAKLLAQFYSADLLKSETARRTWVEPDLKPLP